jgi:hypothetical protein
VIISHQHRFIMLAPWKCASSTCHATLEGYNESPYDRFFDFNPHLNRVVHQHATLAHVLALPEGKLGYRMATFVRNPYDRAYSGFLQIQRDAADQPRFHYAVPWIGDLVRAQVAMNMERMIAAGFEFDRWLELLPDYEVFDAARNTNMPLHPAHYWTHVGGKMMVDFLGRVENFDPDFDRFCEVAGIQRPDLIVANQSPGSVAPENRGYKYAAQMSRRSLDRINDLFAKDFELFDDERV